MELPWWRIEMSDPFRTNLGHSRAMVVDRDWLTSSLHKIFTFLSRAEKTSINLGYVLLWRWMTNSLGCLARSRYLHCRGREHGVWICSRHPTSTFYFTASPLHHRRPCDIAILGILMKFGKTYTEYIESDIQNRLSGCSYDEFKQLKKVLKRCTLHHSQCRPPHVPIFSGLTSSLLGEHHSSPNGLGNEMPHEEDVATLHTSSEMSLSCPS